MIFACLYCGKRFEIYNLKKLKVFCTHDCHNAALRNKAFSKDEIAAERERRLLVYRTHINSPKGLPVKCIICGREMMQGSSTPKLYCSAECIAVQRNTQKDSREDIQIEKERRRRAYLEALSTDHREKIEYNRQKRNEYNERIARVNDGLTLQPTRHCHNYYTKVRCPNLTWDYYCPECRRAKRQGYVEEDYNETESVWDDFSIPQEALHD